MTNLYL